MNNFYKPFGDRKPDGQYPKLMENVLTRGIIAGSAHEEKSYTLLGAPKMVFDMANGFPMTTVRNMAPAESEKLPVTIWKQAIGEICAFINGVRTQRDLEEFGCYWWKDFVTKKKCEKRGLPEGDLGPGSYGPAMYDFPMENGNTFNQIDAMIRQIKARPNLRTHFITPWIPQYTVRIDGITQRVVVCPCHGWMHFRIMDGKLNLTMVQRSGDLPVGVPNNTIQYAALLMMFAYVTGYEPGLLVHDILDAHIYENQVPAVHKMLARSHRPFPTVTFHESVKDEVEFIFDFRHHHFVLSNYDPHPGIKSIPVAI